MFELQKFTLPKKFRGRNFIIVQLWWAIQTIFFASSPQIFYRWRVFLLRLFGAKIGKNVIIRPSVKITYPWKLTIGDFSWIGDNVELYNLGHISIGNNTIISQRSYLCTGSHDYESKYFDIYEKKIIIGNSCWLATDVFVAPGIEIGDNTVVGARSSVFNSLPSDSVCLGSPAKKIRSRQ
jgi:putative colanic acid biosynthesis acetyltransferase WcaF